MVVKSDKTSSLPLSIRGAGSGWHPAAATRRSSAAASTPTPLFVVPTGVAAEVEDVIDLGAPRRLRTAPPDRLGACRVPRQRRPYTPNPRLYPGPPHATKAARPKRREERSGADVRRRKRVFRRPVPNSRLYRPALRPPAAPPAAPPDAPRPRAAWPPPGSPRALDTASHAALRLAERRPPRSPVQAHARGVSGGSGTSAGRRLVVRVPAAGDAPRAALPPAMDAANRHSTSPDCSDGNDAASAPSEFLAEFLSAIMRRQYAEALKYCRLILQYEPHNATARGFYPLLQHKLQKHKTSKEDPSSSEETNLLPEHALKGEPPTEVMEQEADETGSESSGSSGRSGRSGRSRSEEASCASQSSLELDSSEAAVHSSPSVSLSRRTDPTDRTDRTEHTDSTSGGSGASGASGGCWDSSASRSEPDDNGNAPAPRLCAATVAPGDLENDNAGGGGDPRAACTSHLKGDTAGASLRRLRAQFACSIK